MRVKKQVLDLKRLRRVPRQFSWIDQRLVRERYVQRCDVHALALYLLLLTVADAQGLSYYADSTLSGYLSIEEPRLRQARCCLIRAGLIAYQAPLYQVLSLDEPAPARTASMQSLQGSLSQLQARLADKKAATDRDS